LISSLFCVILVEGIGEILMIPILIVLGWTLGLPIALAIGWTILCWIMANVFGEQSWVQGGWAALFGIVPMGVIVGFIIGVTSII